jgi:predicted RNase H-like HicB family nuclease
MHPMAKNGSRAARLSAQAKKRLKYFLCLDYPVRVTQRDAGWHGSYPDLPGVALLDTDLTQLFMRLDQLRRAVIAEAIAQDVDIPHPNSGGFVEEQVPESESTPDERPQARA